MASAECHHPSLDLDPIWRLPVEGLGIIKVDRSKLIPGEMKLAASGVCSAKVFIAPTLSLVSSLVLQRSRLSLRPLTKGRLSGDFRSGLALFTLREVHP